MSGTRDALGSLSSGRRFVTVTPDDDEDLAEPCVALNCSVDGAVSIIGADDTDAVTITVTKGMNATAVKRVRSTGTDAMTIVAVYNA